MTQPYLCGCKPPTPRRRHHDTVWVCPGCDQPWVCRQQRSGQWTWEKWKKPVTYISTQNPEEYKRIVALEERVDTLEARQKPRKRRGWMWTPGVTTGRHT